MKLGIAITAVLTILIIQPSTAPGEYWHGDFVDNRTTMFSENARMYSAPDVEKDNSVEYDLLSSDHVLRLTGKCEIVV